jgi:hypothetical protein
MSPFLWSFVFCDMLPVASAAALVFAAHRWSTTARSQVAWARSLRILGGQLMLLGLLVALSFAALQPIFDTPESDEESDATLAIILLWCSGPFLSGVALRIAAWIFSRRARRTLRMSKMPNEADVFS